jgi:hypothetical protein
MAAIFEAGVPGGIGCGMTTPKFTDNELIQIHLQAEYISSAANVAFWMMGNNDHLVEHHTVEVMKHYAKMKAIVDAAELR